MDSNLSPTQAEPHHGGDVVLVAPKHRTDAEEAVHVTSNERRPAAGPDFSAGPRMTQPSLDPTLRPADVNHDPLPTDRPSLGRRTSRRLARFLVAACVGVAATLAWQSYGGTAKQMLANASPRFSRLLMSPPAMNPPSDREIAIEQPTPPDVQASEQAASAQAGAVASTASETVTSTAPTAPARELQHQLETMEQDLAAVRQSVEQLAAGQEQMARDIAKLHAVGQGQDIRRRTALPPPAAAITAHKPVPPPLPAPQSSTAPLPPPPEGAPQSSAAPLLPAPSEPPRPPMPVR